MNANAMPRAIRLLCAQMCVGLVGISAALASGTPPSSPHRPKDLREVQKRVEDWQPTKQERAFEDIGWAGGLLEAERLAKEHGRGIFLFTYDGSSLAGHRC